MLERASIERRTGPADEYSYDGLRAEGIRLIQELSGGIWTDHNLHDPGITILEQLCYALTDLIYRTEFGTADYLTGPDGAIDFDQHALYRPEAIFPSDPVTVNDYRKMIFDAVPEIDNVWVRKAAGQQPQGVYRIYAQLTEGVEEREGEAVRSRVIDRINEIYAANRNLCEDLDEVRIVEHQHYSLHGIIEVEGNRDPADILAEVYFRASRHVASSITAYSFEEMLNKGKSLEELLTGPLPRHVCVDQDELEKEHEPVTVSDLIGIISEIEGIRYVASLQFHDDQGASVDSLPHDPVSGIFSRLRFPANQTEMGITLRGNDSHHHIILRAVMWEFNRRNAEYLTMRQTPQDFTGILTLPQGVYRDLRSYYSVQDQFPNVYGINRFGLPDSAPAGRKAQARNLKAYLLFFEQVMANFQEGLQEISRLFSLDDQLEQSYFHQTLSDADIPNVEQLFLESVPHDEGDPAQVNGARLNPAQIVKRYDNFSDRRNRVLDYLLGIYGERFNLDTLRRFNFYSGNSPEQESIAIKINLLRAIGNLI